MVGWNSLRKGLVNSLARTLRRARSMVYVPDREGTIWGTLVRLTLTLHLYLSDREQVTPADRIP